MVGYNLGPLSYWTGFNPRNETTLDGAGNSTEYAAVGVTPSVAMVNLSPWTPYNAVVDVRQGGQNYGAALWSDVAVYQGPPIGSALTFSDGLQYDNGYNASVAADPNTFGSSPIGIDYPTSGYTTLVEVHQAAAAISGLWYHVGTVTVTDTGVPALTGARLTSTTPVFSPAWRFVTRWSSRSMRANPAPSGLTLARSAGTRSVGAPPYITMAGTPPRSPAG